MRKLAVISLLIGVFSLSFLNAQERDRPTPPPRETEIPETGRIEREEPRRERLPEFELPEYVITGRATFRLPYVQKKKITEQNIYVVESSDVMTGVNRDLDTSPIDLPTKSFGEFSAMPTIQHGQLRLGYGRFNTPVFSGWVNVRSDEWDASARLSYLNTEGYEPYAEGFDVDGIFQLGYRIPDHAHSFYRNARLHFSIGFEGLKYGLFSSMVFDTTETEHGFPLLPGVTDLRERTFRSNYSEIGFQSGTDAPFDYDATLAWRGSTLQTDDGAIPQMNDDEYIIRLSTLGYIESVRIRTGLEYIANDLDFETEELYNDPRFFRGTVTTLFPVLRDRFTAELGGSYYSTRHSHTDGYESSLKPFIEIRLMPMRSLTIYGRYAPEMIHRSVYSLQKLNPYIGWWSIDFPVHDVDPQGIKIVPSNERINVSTGIEYIPHRRLAVNSFLQYREVRDYPGVMMTDTYGTVYITDLGNSTIFSLHGDIRYAIGARDILTSQMTLNYTKNDFFDRTIPYIAPVEVAAMYTREFPFGLRASAGFEYLSPRRGSYYDSGPESLGALVNLNLDVQFQFHNIVGVYTKIDNILNQKYERYYTYMARPFYIEGGIQFTF